MSLLIALPRLLPVKTWPRRTREGGIRGPKAGLLLSRLEAPRASAMLLCEWSCLAAASRDAEDSVYNTSGSCIHGTRDCSTMNKSTKYVQKEVCQTCIPGQKEVTRPR